MYVKITSVKVAINCTSARETCGLWITQLNAPVSKSYSLLASKEPIEDCHHPERYDERQPGQQTRPHLTLGDNSPGTSPARIAMSGFAVHNRAALAALLGHPLDRRGRP
jgi:hypothetical protein